MIMQVAGMYISMPIEFSMTNRLSPANGHQFDFQAAIATPDDEMFQGPSSA